MRRGLSALGALAACAVIASVAVNWPKQKAPATPDNAVDDALKKQLDAFKAQTVDGFNAVNGRLDEMGQAIKNMQQPKQPPIDVHVECNPVIYQPTPAPIYELPIPVPMPMPEPQVAPAPRTTTTYNGAGDRVVYIGGTRYVENGDQQWYPQQDYGCPQWQQPQGQYQTQRQSIQRQQPQRQSIQRQPPQRQSNQCLTRGNGPGPTSGSITRPGSSGSRGGITTGSRGGGMSRPSMSGNRGASLGGGNRPSMSGNRGASLGGGNRPSMSGNRGASNGGGRSRGR